MGCLGYNIPTPTMEDHLRRFGIENEATHREKMDLWSWEYGGGCNLNERRWCGILWREEWMQVWAWVSNGLVLEMECRQHVASSSWNSESWFGGVNWSELKSIKIVKQKNPQMAKSHSRLLAAGRNAAKTKREGKNKWELTNQLHRNEEEQRSIRRRDLFRVPRNH